MRTHCRCSHRLANRYQRRSGKGPEQTGPAFQMGLQLMKERKCVLKKLRQLLQASRGRAALPPSAAVGCHQ